MILFHSSITINQNTCTPKLQAGVVRAAVAALGQITAAQDPTDWPSAVAPFNCLLKLSLDPRPKARKVAQTAVTETLAALNSVDGTVNASEAVLKGEHPIASPKDAA